MKSQGNGSITSLLDIEECKKQHGSQLPQKFDPGLCFPDLENEDLENEDKKNHLETAQNC